MDFDIINDLLIKYGVLVIVHEVEKLEYSGSYISYI